MLDEYWILYGVSFGVAHWLTFAVLDGIEAVARALLKRAKPNA